MPAKLTLLPTDGPSRVFVFEEGRNHFLGRDPASDLALDDARVSARHALLQWAADRWVLVDLRSKNGTFVNGSRITEVPLQDNDWISFGGLLARFQRAGSGEIEELVGRRGERLQKLDEAAALLRSSEDRAGLARRAVLSALELTESERGFLLIFDPAGETEAEVASGFAPFEPVDERFAEILGTVERALRTGEPVAASDARPEAFERGRRSTVETTLHALVCAPVRRPDATSGVLFADRRRRGGLFTDLELELLQRLAETVGGAWSGLPPGAPVRELLSAGGPRSSSSPASFLEELERKIRAVAFPPLRRAPRLTPHG